MAKISNNIVNTNLVNCPCYKIENETIKTCHLLSYETSSILSMLHFSDTIHRKGPVSASRPYYVFSSTS